MIRSLPAARTPPSSRTADDEVALSAARRRIDAIDDSILDLLRERAKIVADVAAAKRRAGEDARSAFRPEREAVVLRRLHARVREEGGPPFDGVARVWREIMTAALLQQEPVAVAVSREGATGGAELLQLAREHFGSAARVARHEDLGQMYAAVRDRRGLVGLVGSLADFAVVAEPGERAPKVFAALPFFGEAEPGAFAFGHVRLAESGDDQTLVAVESPDRRDGAGYLDALAEAEFSAIVAARGGSRVIISVSGFHVDGQSRGRLDDALDNAGHPWFVLGAYATPLGVSEA